MPGVPIAKDKTAGREELLFISKDKNSRERAKKLNDKWIGPHRIYEAPEDSTFYRIEELDGTRLAESIAGNRLKKVFSRKDLLEDRALWEWVLREMDETTEATQRQFAERHADRLTELEEMVERAGMR